mmetsp:Transcript_21361/g.36396  ORF Transcript_21361/g.36396 Transcript_21361/m.36396 type:complete len:279 (+) Transcript_21361:71-907(+)
MQEDLSGDGLFGLMDDEQPDSAQEEAFNAAGDHVASSVTAGDPAFTDKLKLLLYGLYKQATAGPCTAAQPAFWNMAARAKWDAWHKVGGMSQQEAKVQYYALVAQIAPDWASKQAGQSQGGGHSAGHSGFGPVFSMYAGEEAEPQGSGDGSPCSSTQEQGLHELAGQGDVLGMEELLAAGAAVNARDAEGCTALHFAADRGQLNAARTLLPAGADLDAQDTDGSTPLHYSALCGHEEVAKLLLEAGADSSIQDAAGSTAAAIAPKSWQCFKNSLAASL